MAKLQNEVQLLSLKCTNWKQRREVLASEKKLRLIKFLLLQSLTICLDMEQFILVPASLYNTSWNTPLVAKQKPPKYQAIQNSTYQILIHLKRIETKSCLPKQTLQSTKIFLPSYQALKFTDFNFGWCGNWSFTVRLCSTTSSWKRRRSRHLLYFTWHCRSISNSESKCQSQTERKQSLFQKKNIRSCEGRCCLWVRAQFKES